MKETHKYQGNFGITVVERAIKRLSDVVPCDTQKSDYISYIIKGRPDLGDTQDNYQVSIKTDVLYPKQLRDTENATCTCEPEIYTAKRKRNHCSHIIACDLYRQHSGKELKVNPNIDARTGSFKIVLTKQEDILLEKIENHFVDLGQDWKKHFYYSGGVFALKNNTLYNLRMALEYLENYCEVVIDIEFFKNYFGAEESPDIIKIEEQAKNIEVKLEGERVFYYFNPTLSKFR